MYEYFMLLLRQDEGMLRPRVMLAGFQAHHKGPTIEKANRRKRRVAKQPA